MTARRRPVHHAIVEQPECVSPYMQTTCIETEVVAAAALGNDDADIYRALMRLDECCYVDATHRIAPQVTRKRRRR